MFGDDVVIEVEIRRDGKRFGCRAVVPDFGDPLHLRDALIFAFHEAVSSVIRNAYPEEGQPAIQCTDDVLD
jgi:hypothetical protein